MIGWRGLDIEVRVGGEAGAPERAFEPKAGLGEEVGPALKVAAYGLTVEKSHAAVADVEQVGRGEFEADVAVVLDERETRAFQRIYLFVP